MILPYYGLNFMLRFIMNGFKTTKTVLFYPQRPYNCYMIYKICRLLGYSVINNPKQKFDIVMSWEDATFRKSPFLSELARTKAVLNIGCNDISKKRIDSVFRQAFGYALSIDPLSYEGRCVKKSDLNGKRDGRIIDCPVEKPEDGFVYQMLIDNTVGDSLVQDIRVPVFGEQIPLVYLKQRSISNRFGNTTHSSRISGVYDNFSCDEVEKIILFCKKMGLDYGELDILRNKGDGKIYIVDVNSTPSGPPTRISGKEAEKALRILARAFEETFVN